MQRAAAQLLQNALGGAAAAQVHHQRAGPFQPELRKIGPRRGGLAAHRLPRQAAAEGADRAQQLAQGGLRRAGRVAAQVKGQAGVIAGQAGAGGKAAERQNFVHPQQLTRQRGGQQFQSLGRHGAHQKRRAQAFARDPQVGGVPRAVQAAGFPHQGHIPRQQHQPAAGAGGRLRLQPGRKADGQRPQHRKAESLLPVPDVRGTVGKPGVHGFLLRGFGVRQVGGQRRAAWGVDTVHAGQRRAQAVRPAVVAEKHHVPRAQAGALQKHPEQPAAALLHAVLGRDKDPVPPAEAAAVQQRADRVRRQVHIRHGVHRHACGPAAFHQCQHAAVGHAQRPLGRDLGGGVQAGQTGPGVDLGQGHLPPRRGGAGLGLGLAAVLGKAGGGMAAGFHPGKHIRRGGHVPVEQGIEHIKGGRLAAAGQFVLRGHGGPSFLFKTRTGAGQRGAFWGGAG